MFRNRAEAARKREKLVICHCAIQKFLPPSTRADFVVSISLEVHIYLFDQRWSTSDTGEIPTSG